jgi:hypothetical protein
MSVLPFEILSSVLYNGTVYKYLVTLDNAIGDTMIMIRQKKGPAKAVATSMRLDPAIKSALEKAAKANRRTATAQMQAILEVWLRSEGFLK